MTIDYIQMLFYEPGEIKFIPTTAFEFKYTRWRRLEMFCHWILNKTGCLVPHFDKSQMVRQVVIDKKQAVTKIVAMAKEQLWMMEQVPERIYLGRSQYVSLMMEIQELQLYRPVHFDLEMAIPKAARERWGTNKELFTLPIYVIPWMDGVLVV